MHDSTDRGSRRLRLPRRRWLLAGSLVAVLAIAVPVAWATFSDVPPSNPFYADINAIQGAGITGGCGSGNFCPTDNITRQAEAAFVHRGAGRTGYSVGSTFTVSGSATDAAVVTIDVGGAAGQTQFVKLDAAATTWINSTSGCPCQTQWFILRDGGGNSDNRYTANTFVGTSGYGLDSAGPTAVFAVPSGTTQTFRLRASTWDGTGTVTGYAELTAITGPFGSVGTNVLGGTQSSASVPAGAPNAKRTK